MKEDQLYLIRLHFSSLEARRLIFTFALRIRWLVGVELDGVVSPHILDGIDPLSADKDVVKLSFGGLIGMHPCPQVFRRVWEAELH